MSSSLPASSTVPLSNNQALHTVPAEAYAPAFTVSPVTPGDYAEMGALHDAVFGPGALTRTAYRLREGMPYHSPFCRVTRKVGALVAMIRFTPITIGGTGNALMLGPLAVAPAYANQGHARRLIAEGIDAARLEGIRIVILVGDRPYYGRLGFVLVSLGQITMPGPVDPARLLAFEVSADALASYRGLIAADRAGR